MPGRAFRVMGQDEAPARDRIVLHVDMDAFYAAVEARDDPRLRDVPLVIGADPRGGAGRGVVCTADYIARRYGIHSAMPISKAFEACPHATFLRPDFPRYKAASRRVMEVLERYADVLEVVGMDEAYLDVTRACGGWDHAEAFARSLQAAVRRATGLSCSVGAAPTKSAAKVASDRRKPHGVTVVRPGDLSAFLDPLPVRLVNGCGPKTAARLSSWDIRTVGELAATDPAWLEERLGTHGRWLHRVAGGDDPRPVVADRGPPKSRGNERTFLRDERHPAHVLATAGRLLSELLDEARRRDGRAFTTLTVKVRYRGFLTLTRAHTAHPLDPAERADASKARAVVDALLRPLLDGRPVRLVGVRLSGFTDATGQQPLSRFGIALPPVLAGTHTPVEEGVAAGTHGARAGPPAPSPS